MTMPTIEDAVAIVPVRDVNVTMEFYTSVLGFERQLVTDEGEFGIAIHGRAAVHFLRVESDEALHATANHISVYLWVNGIDKLFEELRPNLTNLAPDRWRVPFDQPYGMREFHIKDPDGCLLMFGQPVEQTG